MSNTSLEKSKIRILLLEGVHQSAIDTLNAAGYTNIEYLSHSLAEEELIEKIADLVREKRIEGIADLWDESNREGMRIVIELKMGEVSDVVAPKP